MNTDETLFAKEIEFSDNYVPPSGYRTSDTSADVYPFFHVSIFESEYKCIIDKYVELYIKYSQKSGIIELDETVLVEYGYTVYLTEINDTEIAHILLVNGEKAIDIECNQKLTEDNIKQILQSLQGVN